MQLASRIKDELVTNILPFWRRYAMDEANGGFYGKVSCDLEIDKYAPRPAVITARILWTYAAAVRLGFEDYRDVADHAFNYLANRFWDEQYGGVYWMLDWRGRPVSDRKQIYAQAFAIYALAEYHRATGEPKALECATELYNLIENNSYDREYKGYIEACSRDWGPLEDMRLSEKDLNSPKSMNTHLHVLEAWTNLMRVWPYKPLESSQFRLINVMMDRVLDSETGHFKLFFDMQWNPLNDRVSYGHDIEGSWLLVEAAEVLEDDRLLERARRVALRMAQTVYDQGLDKDGSLFYEADAAGNLIDPNKHWWAQAEAVVGFYNAWQISGNEQFREAALRIWDYIEQKVVDKTHGEWHAKLKPDGTPFTEAEDPDACLVGPWKCPYHNARVCYEMLDRLEA